MISGFRNVCSKDGTLNIRIKDKDTIRWIKAQCEELNCPVSEFADLLLRQMFEQYYFYTSFTKFKECQRDFKPIRK